MPSLAVPADLSCALRNAANRLRTQRICAIPVEYIPHSDFDEPLLAKFVIDTPMPDADVYAAKKRAAKTSVVQGSELQTTNVPLLSKEQEQHLFRQYNYLKHQARQIQESIAEYDRLPRRGWRVVRIDYRKARPERLDRIESLLRRAQGIFDTIIEANVKLVSNCVKRYTSDSKTFFELLSDGNVSLIRAAMKFDFSRLNETGKPNKFSTYATWAIQRNLSRELPSEAKRSERFSTSHDDLLGNTEDHRKSEFELMDEADDSRRRTSEIMSILEPRDQEIVRLKVVEGKTLEQIGAMFDVTKQRVQQRYNAAMKKLRAKGKEMVAV